MKGKSFIRTLCIVLCAALFLGTFAVLFSAVNADEDPIAEALPVDGEVLPADGAVLLAQEDAAPTDGGEPSVEAADAILEPPAPVVPAEPAVQAPISSNPFRNATDWFFRTFGFIGFILDPYQFTIINQKPVFQFLLGFNDFYDMFPWVVNVWADTLKCEFNYAGKDWRIQLWKGGYAVCLATGGEIGIYNKPEGQSVDHYSAPSSQNDWMYLTYTIYNRGKKLFTRPSPKLGGDEGPYWWCPGYKILSICTDFMSNPRKNVVMDATIQLHSPEMARLFIASLEKKGFRPLVEAPLPEDPPEDPGEDENEDENIASIQMAGIQAEPQLSLSTPERYVLLPDGKSVRLIWQNKNEGRY